MFEIILFIMCVVTFAVTLKITYEVFKKIKKDWEDR